MMLTERKLNTEYAYMYFLMCHPHIIIVYEAHTHGSDCNIIFGKIINFIMVAVTASYNMKKIYDNARKYYYLKFIRLDISYTLERAFLLHFTFLTFPNVVFLLPCIYISFLLFISHLLVFQSFFLLLLIL